MLKSSSMILQSKVDKANDKLASSSSKSKLVCLNARNTCINVHLYDMYRKLPKL